LEVFAYMIEALMYFGIGFLLAALSVLVVTPLVHGRAVRLTTRRVKATIPQSFAEVVADKDLLRAEFAMSTRRLETNVEQLKTKSANQLAELGSKADAINRLKVEVGTLREQLRVTEEELAVKTSATRDAQRRLFEKDAELAKPMSELDKRSSIVDAQTVEIISLKTRIEALKEQLTAADSELKAEGDVIPLMPTAPMDFSQSPSSSDQHHEGDVIPLMPKVPMDSSQSPSCNDQHHEGDVIPLVPKVSPTAGKVPISSQSPPPQRQGDVTPLVPKVSARKVPMDSQSPREGRQVHR
jgi:hypothetical protein